MLLFLTTQHCIVLTVDKLLLAIMEPTFDAATSAASQILQLPIEIIEMIGKECDSFQDVKNLRATHRQLAAYLDDMFYAKAQVHIAVCERVPR